MREAYVHEALLAAPAVVDDSAPGAAVTFELCGSWDHPPPCPLAPHHTRVHRVGDQLGVRTLFAAEPAREAEVRRRIDRALAGGSVPGRSGGPTWTLLWSHPGTVDAEEADHAERLMRS